MTSLGFLRVIKFGIQNVLRNQWLSLASTIVIAITLFIIGVFAIQSFVIVSTTQGIQDKLDLQIFFNDDALDESIQEIRRQFANRPDVASVEFISKEAAFEIFQNRQVGERIKSQVTPENNPLPRSLIINANDPDRLGTLAKLFESQEYQPLVRRISYQDNQSVVESLVATAKTVRRNGWLLASIFLLISLILIYNTTRIVILSRADEIEIMRLVGSTEAFVRWPFLIEAAIFGVVGTGLALVAIYFFLSKDLASATPILSIAKFLAPDMLAFFTGNLLWIGLASLLVGVTTSMLMSFVAVRRYVRL